MCVVCQYIWLFYCLVLKLCWCRFEQAVFSLSIGTDSMMWCHCARVGWCSLARERVLTCVSVCQHQHPYRCSPVLWRCMNKRWKLTTFRSRIANSLWMLSMPMDLFLAYIIYLGFIIHNYTYVYLHAYKHCSNSINVLNCLMLASL